MDDGASIGEFPANTWLPCWDLAHLCAEDSSGSSASAELMHVPAALNTAQSDQNGALETQLGVHPQPLSARCPEYQDSLDAVYHQTSAESLQTFAMISNGLPEATHFLSPGAGLKAYFPDFTLAAPELYDTQIRTTASYGQFEHKFEGNKAGCNSTAESPLALSIPATTGDALAERGPPSNVQNDLIHGGIQCPHPACNVRRVFLRQCDFNKHYRLHLRKHSCRVPDCRFSDGHPRMFTLKKDRNRHEATHKQPSLTCFYCGRPFNRQDNLRDHCRKLHSRSI